MLLASLASSIEILQPYLWPLGISLLVTMAVMPIVKSVAIAGQIFDLPDSGLKPHEKPVPYLGGVGMYIGWAAAVCFAAATIPASRAPLLTILAAGTLMMLTGLIDDIRDLKPRTKLILELVAAAILIYGGIGDRVAGVIFANFDWIAPAWMLRLTSAAVTVFLLLGAGNATNLIDGLDGLCSGVIAIISIGFVVLAAHLAVGGHSKTFDPVRLTVAVALFGACFAFLRYNFNPAQMFMGDAGSLLLGFNAAVLMLLFAEKDKARWFIGALMVFALPVFDTALAIARRWLNGKPLFIGDRSHFYDQLRQRGFSVRRTVLISYGVAFLYVMIGCLVVFVRGRYAALIFLSVFVLTVITVIRLGMLRKEPDSTSP